MNKLDFIEKKLMKTGHIESYAIGDTVRVYNKIIEAKKERTQIYEGIVIADKHDGIRKTITVRKISSGVGVEKVFPINSPMVEKIEVINKGLVRRAKLYFIRSLRGKAARIKNKKFEEFIPQATPEPIQEVTNPSTDTSANQA